MLSCNAVGIDFFPKNFMYIMYLLILECTISSICTLITHVHFVKVNINSGSLFTGVEGVI